VTHLFNRCYAETGWFWTIQKATLLLLSQDKASHLNIENQAKLCASPKMLAKGARAFVSCRA
jgi:hypothetical protein